MRSSLRRSSKQLARLALVGLALAVGGCATAPSAGAPRAVGGADALGSPDGDVRAPGGAAAGGIAARGVPSDVIAYRRLEALLAAWDDSQGAGRMDEAHDHAARLQQEVDAQRGLLDAAARGREGAAAQALAVSVLAFASDGTATAILVRTLESKEPRIVGNALIALGIRSDAETPLGPLLAYCERRWPLEIRRFAPLAVAHVVDARAQRGVSLDATAKANALIRLGALAADSDPVVRLHAVKGLGVIDAAGAVELLIERLKDGHVRVRYGAAAALERTGDARGFQHVVLLLANAPPDALPMLGDLVASYAERMQGRPLDPAERAALGSNARAWSRWFDEYRRGLGIQPGSAEARRILGR